MSALRSRLVCLALLGHVGEVVAAAPFQFMSDTRSETRTAVLRRCRRCSHTWSRAVHGDWSVAELSGDEFEMAALPSPALTTARARLLAAADEVVERYRSPQVHQPQLARLVQALVDVRAELDGAR